MRELPDQPDLNQLRRQARELHRAAARGEGAASERVHAISPRVTLSSAQLALARESASQVGPGSRPRSSAARSAVPDPQRHAT